jgi:LmbE family N-acetylglucosaminyl deacetylase
MKKIIVISPHPDDETLGCGGTILKHNEDGDSVYWLIMTNTLIEEGYDELAVKTRQKEVENIASNYQFKNIFRLDFPATKLDVCLRGNWLKPLAM